MAARDLKLEKTGPAARHSALRSTRRRAGSLAHGTIHLKLSVAYSSGRLTPVDAGVA